MTEKMNSELNQEKFENLLINKKSSRHLGIRACARYNRGEECTLGKWHSTYKSESNWPSNRASRMESLQQDQGNNSKHKHSNRRNELRLHVCTLCLEALGSANGHCVLDCPWILKKNWKE